MSDVRCAVCSEPWDTYHLRHDEPSWVRAQFYEGRGCPSCEGHNDSPDASDAALMSHVADRITGPDDDDTSAGTDLEPRKEARAPWKRPEDPTVIECAGCGLKVKRDVDSGSSAGPWVSSPFYVETKQPYSGVHRFEKDVEADNTTEADVSGHFHGVEDRKGAFTVYCPLCACVCSEPGCDAVCVSDGRDLYDAGGCVHLGSYGENTVCSTCYEGYCGECQKRQEDCACESDTGENETD